MDKPPHGQPCNGCGLCCRDSVCPLGETVLGVPRDRPCPALRKAQDGTSACGLVVEPEAYAPVLAFLNGRESLSRAAAFLIGAGLGCDWSRAHEPRDEAFTRFEWQYAKDHRQEAKWAIKMWGIRKPGR